MRVVREQRHNGTRTIIATQEPTIAPELLDLCNISIVHRFSSPAWMHVLRGHLAAAFSVGRNSEQDAGTLFNEIINLDVGESLLFSPSATMEADDGVVIALRGDRVKIRTRPRITEDGGRSVMGTQSGMTGHELW